MTPAPDRSLLGKDFRIRVVFRLAPTPQSVAHFRIVPGEGPLFVSKSERPTSHDRPLGYPNGENESPAHYVTPPPRPSHRSATA